MSYIIQKGRAVQIAALQVGIAVCVLALTFINLWVAARLNDILRFWFLLNGLGDLGFLIAFFLPRLAPRHHLVSFLLAGYAVLIVVVWFVLGQPGDLVGYTTSVIELVLVALAWYEGRRTMRVRSIPFVLPPFLNTWVKKAGLIRSRFIK